MKTQHFFENGIYLISNFAVAGNEIFAEQEMQHYFMNKMDKYLRNLCEIIAYSLNENQFQLLVRLKGRSEFEKSFLSQKKNRNLRLDSIPDSTYIFSQAMANLQVSLVKYYNYKNNRKGGLMAGRFGRKLIESSSDLNNWIDRLNFGKRLHIIAERWMVKLTEGYNVRTSEWLYAKVTDNVYSSKTIFQNVYEIDLGGYFENLPPKRLKDASRYFKLRFNQLFGPKPGPVF